MQTPPRYAKIYKCQNKSLADVVEQADTRDLKSLGGDFVPVQIRSSAPVRGWLCGRKKHRRTQPSAFLRHAFAAPLECRCSGQFEIVVTQSMKIERRGELLLSDFAAFRKKERRKEQISETLVLGQGLCG